MRKIEPLQASRTRIRDIYRSLLGRIPASVRLGRRFAEWYAFFEVSEEWSREELARYQVERLRVLLSELVRTSAYYRGHMKGLNPQRLDSLDSFFSGVPIMSRQEFRQHYPAILSTTWRTRFLSAVSTSGTTGTALQFYHPRKDHAREWAAICHQWKRVGFDPFQSVRAEFRGLTGRGRIVEHFPADRMIRCSVLHLKAEHIRHYADQVARHRVDYLHGYPSAVYLLARGILNHTIRFPALKGVLLASENVFDWQLGAMEEAFPDARLYAHYGCAERTVLAGWCENKREYHVLPQYAIVEIDPQTREIIGTNLFNDVNGFVRYRMTDTCIAASEEVCPGCGRPYTPRLTQIGGRTEDYLYSPQNGWIPPAIVTYPLKSLAAVREVQIRQQEPDRLIVAYAVDEAADTRLLAADTARLGDGLMTLFGRGMRVEFRRVDHFERGRTGKFPWIICDLDMRERSTS